MPDLNIEQYDGVEERLIKVYPYELLHASQSEEFIGAQTTSIAYISQDKLDVDDELLQTDKFGGKYFEMFAAITSEGKLDLSSSTSTLGQELKQEDSFTAVSNWYYEGQIEDVKIGGLRMLPVVFTIGRHYNPDDYGKGEQEVFIATSMIEAKEGQSQFSDLEIDPEGMYEFSLSNVNLLEAQFTNSKILFTTEGATLENPKVDYNGSQITGFAIKPDPTLLINSIKAKGKTEFNDELTDINLKIKEHIIPIKSTPVSVKDNLTMFMDWFDYDVVLPQYIANVFQDTAGVKLSSLKSVDFEKNGVSVNFFNDAQLHLMQDVILVSSLFADSFSDPSYRYTAAEAKDAGGGAKAGDIKGILTVGNSKMSMFALADKDPIKAIDGIFETYLRENPGDEDSTQYLAIKEIFAAASRYIYSSYSIGKGQNAFNQIYLPWYIRPMSKIEIIAPGSSNNVLLSDETRWRLESKWFDFSKRQFEAFAEADVSKVKLVQTDRKLTVPEVPYTIQAIDKLPLPGDIDTKSSKDLQYMWYLPFVKPSDFGKLFLGSPTSTTEANPTITFTTGWTRPGESITDIPDFIIDQYVSINGIPDKSKIHYKAEGKLAEQSVRENSLNPSGSLAIYKLSGITGIFNPQGGYGPATEDNLNLNLAEEIADYWRAHGKPWMDVSKIRIVDGKGFTIDNTGYYYYSDSFGVEFVSTRYEDAQIISDSKQTSYDIEREILFDKSSWRKFIADNHFAISPELTLVDSDNTEIKKIDEIIISSVWGTEIQLMINSSTHTIQMFNQDDETISVQRIIFT